MKLIKQQTKSHWNATFMHYSVYHMYVLCARIVQKKFANENIKSQTFTKVQKWYKKRHIKY